VVAPLCPQVTQADGDSQGLKHVSGISG